jgi:iron-sulfur cluster repair protein YtfE (RIC family)
MASMWKLRKEHDELLPRIGDLLLIADRVGDAPADTLHEMIDDIYDFLAAHLIPHAQAEDAILYPAVETVTGSPGSTATMSRDHIEVARMTEELRRIRGDLEHAASGYVQERELRRLLYGLYAIVRLHFAKEEEILVPLLERGLTDEQAARMFVEMQEEERSRNAAATERVRPGSRTLHA